jgi:hypothetical protein
MSFAISDGGLAFHEGKVNGCKLQVGGRDKSGFCGFFFIFGDDIVVL